MKINLEEWAVEFVRQGPDDKKFLALAKEGLRIKDTSDLLSIRIPFETYSVVRHEEEAEPPISY